MTVNLFTPVGVVNGNCVSECGTLALSKGGCVNPMNPHIIQLPHLSIGFVQVQFLPKHL